MSFLEFRTKAPLLSEADRSTLSLARHRLLLCASDDGLMIEICEQYSINYTRMLRLLTQMVNTEHKTVAEVKAMAQILIVHRKKRIAPNILEYWYNDLANFV